MSDYIQEQVNKATEESIERWRKHIQYKVSQSRHKLNMNKKKRKMERQNRRKGRL